ncbi:ATP-binding protein [Streptomyces sp. NPDC059874]|uniref:sensor histidine kinase n=1 Tax=Streptomyces sp. NPDC059874 TaxID=3346983 RepID=UPI00364E5CB5
MSGLRAARHSPSRHAATGPGRQIRPQLIRAAVLPTLAAGFSGAAAVIFTLQLGGGAGDRDARLWPVLTGCALLVVGALAAALLGAQRAGKAVRDRCEALRRSSVRGRQELRAVADRLERGETPPRPVRGGGPTGPGLGADPAGIDEFWLLSQELRGAREQAHTALVRLAGPVAPSDSERKVEVFVNLARRLQSLVHREISLLDDLEDTVEDPDLLRDLFHVDHLATRIRRHAENLAVLGGAASRRQWTRPIDLSEVLRSSVAEVEQYTRVKVVPPAGGSVRGHAVADVVHLLAELVENATVFSAPDTDVVVRAERVTAGIAVEVEDRGLGMPAEEQHRMNALLGDPDQISVRHLLADGRIGLYVVSALARRHGIAVELKSNIYGGVLAVLVLPQELLGAAAATGPETAPPPRLEPVRVPAPTPAWAPTNPTPYPAPRPTPASEPDDASCPEYGPDARPAPEPGPTPDLAPRPAYGAGAAPAPGSAPEPGRTPGAAVRPAYRAGAAPAPGSAPGPGPTPGAAVRPVSGADSVAEAGSGSRLRPAGAALPSPRTEASLDPEPPPLVPRAGAAGAAAPVTPPVGTAPPPLPVRRAGAATSAAPVASTGTAPGGGRPGLSAEPAAGERRRPELPRRRAQQHLAPQLREAPAPRRAADDAEQPVHDPGLMAAFQRGFGLAQSENQA